MRALNTLWLIFLVGCGVAQAHEPKCKPEVSLGVPGTCDSLEGLMCPNGTVKRLGAIRKTMNNPGTKTIGVITTRVERVACNFVCVAKDGKSARAYGYFFAVGYQKMIEKKKKL